MPKQSAGLLLYRRKNSVLQVFLVHPGGPFFAGKDAGAWSVPKGELEEGEDALVAAKREFAEETGCRPEGSFIPLPAVKQKSGKLVHAWAVEGDCDAEAVRSNIFTLEWPPRSGRFGEFPEVDRAGWFTIDEARKKINQAQSEFLDQLEARVASDVIM